MRSNSGQIKTRRTIDATVTTNERPSALSDSEIPAWMAPRRDAAANSMAMTNQDQHGAANGRSSETRRPTSRSLLIARMPHVRGSWLTSAFNNEEDSNGVIYLEEEHHRAQHARRNPTFLLDTLERVFDILDEEAGDNDLIEDSNDYSNAAGFFSMCQQQQQ
mmetsp:Transcript_114215/g.170858  ORF Transcript_114215/g.170858 Transcript_114215/m.170858 type:complete len:162 (-) Transcript_114215:129-614(-)